MLSVLSLQHAYAAEHAHNGTQSAHDDQNTSMGMQQQACEVYSKQQSPKKSSHDVTESNITPFLQWSNLNQVLGVQYYNIVAAALYLDVAVDQVQPAGSAINLPILLKSYNGFHSQVGANGISTIAYEGAHVVHISGLACFQQQAC